MTGRVRDLATGVNASGATASASAQNRLERCALQKGDAGVQGWQLPSGSLGVKHQVYDF